MKLNKRIEIYNGDCLKVLDELYQSNIKVDLILTDLPYGRTQNHWDNIIPFDLMWDKILKVIKDNATIVFFGQSLFTAKLILSNEKMYKYSLIWNKELPTGFLNASVMPLTVHEDIVIFCKGKTIYNPQKYKGSKNHSVGDKNTGIVVDKNNYGKFVQLDRKDILGDMKFPRSILNFQRIKSEQLHPTQKPVELLNYLIRTYSNVGDLVLDFTAGVMSTGVACIETSRKFIGIELNENYFNLGKERLEFEINRKVQKSLF